MEYNRRSRIASHLISCKPRHPGRAIVATLLSTTALTFVFLMVSAKLHQKQMRPALGHEEEEKPGRLTVLRDDPQHAKKHARSIPPRLALGGDKGNSNRTRGGSSTRPPVVKNDKGQIGSARKNSSRLKVIKDQGKIDVNSNKLTKLSVELKLGFTSSITTSRSGDLEERQETQDLSCNFTDRVKVDILNRTFVKGPLTRCIIKPSTLVGRFIPVMEAVSHDQLVAMFVGMQDGGHYTPRMCTPIEKTAIIIPYRNRCRHLYTLLPNLIPMLMRQNVDFTIFVVEQSTPGTYNKGILFNAGYLEALKVYNYDCFILHDVDMIPVDDRNMYRCNKLGPIHFSSALDKFNYSVEYEALFGGVVSFTREQFRLINGASNLYFGWGAEDDDLRNRAVNKNLTLLRKNKTYAVYNMVKHNTSRGFEPNPDRKKIYGSGRSRYDIDGLNSVVYNVTSLRTSALYTWLGIAFDNATILSTVPEKLRMGKSYYDSYLRKKFEIIP